MVRSVREVEELGGEFSRKKKIIFSVRLVGSSQKLFVLMFNMSVFEKFIKLMNP